MHVAEDSDTDSVPDLQTVPDSSSEGDDDDPDSDVEGEDFTGHPGAMLAGNPPTEDEEIIFDSGATSHMSPHLHNFISYRPITPKSIHAADSHTFRGVSRGDMWITVPTSEDGTETTRVLLRNLHAPSMDVTLVSIGRIVWSGSTVEFQSKGCRVSNSAGNVIACIPLVRGLYRTKMRRGESAMSAMLEGESEEGEPTEIREITLDEAHRKVGPIQIPHPVTA